MIKGLSLLLSLTLFLGLFAPIRQALAQKERVKIGVIIPLSGSLSHRGDDITQTAGVMQEQLSQHSAKNGEGVIFIGTPNVEHSSAAFKEFYSTFLRRHPSGPSYEALVRSTFDAIQSITDSIEAVGPSPAKVKEYLKTYKADGSQGIIEYDQNGDLKDIAYALRITTASGHRQLSASEIGEGNSEHWP